MSTYTFGVGYLFGRRTDIATTTPSYLGVTQSFDLSTKQTIKKLMGQFKYAVDAAGAECDITGKVKFARWQANAINDLLFGQTITSGAGRQVSVIANGLPEQHPAAASVTVTNVPDVNNTDLGVFYATTGKQLKRVGAAPAIGQYTLVDATGVYTFNAGETGTLNFFYEYTVTTQASLAIANALMGFVPTFEIHYQAYYVNNLGIANTLHIKLNACRGDMFDMPFKNADYAVLDFGFQAFADSAGNVATFDFTE